MSLGVEKSKGKKHSLQSSQRKTEAESKLLSGFTA